MAFYLVTGGAGFTPPHLDAHRNALRQNKDACIGIKEYV